MQMTNHANKRKQQRCISNTTIEIIKQYGRELPASNGCKRIFFGNKEYNNLIFDIKKTLHYLEKARGASLIVNNDKVVTLYELP